MHYLNFQSFPSFFSISKIASFTTYNIFQLRPASRRKEFQELTANFGTLFKKYGNLEKQCEIFQCELCAERFANKGELMKHKKCHKLVLPGKFDCDKSFDEQWKYDAHVKIHKKYPCAKCVKKNM